MFISAGRSLRIGRGKILAAVAPLALCAVLLTASGAHATEPAGFAPYVDMTLHGKAKNTDNIRQSGARAATLSFIVSGATCQASWGGYYGLNSSDSWFDATQLIADIRAAGSEPIISFGGAAGQSLARTCTSPAALAAEYQSVIDAYNVRNLDYDIEGSDQADPSSLKRRFQAIAKVQADGIAAGKPVTISLTLPTMPSGLTYNGMNVVRSAIANGVDVSVVNVMAMNYYDPSQNPAGKLGDFAVQAGENLKVQLTTLYPNRSEAALYRMVSVTPMIGINDNPVEIFTTADATKLLNWANAKSIGRIAMWSLNRDFQCESPISYASIHCSGVTQTDLDFAKIWKAFAPNSPGGDVAAAVRLDFSQTKRWQKAKKLRLKNSCGDEISCTVKLTAEAKIPRKGKKGKSFKLKPKSYGLSVGQTKKVKHKFKKHKGTLKKIARLQRSYKKAAKRSKVIVKVKASTSSGATASAKHKIKLKR